MTELHLELAIKFDTSPTGGLDVSLVRRGRSAVTPMRRWSWKLKAITANELEDLQAAVGLAITECFLTTSGVQLILHD